MIPVKVGQRWILNFKYNQYDEVSTDIVIYEVIKINSGRADVKVLQIIKGKLENFLYSYRSLLTQNNPYFNWQICQGQDKIELQ